MRGHIGISIPHRSYSFREAYGVVKVQKKFQSLIGLILSGDVTNAGTLTGKFQSLIGLILSSDNGLFINYDSKFQSLIGLILSQVLPSSSMKDS